MRRGREEGRRGRGEKKESGKGRRQGRKKGCEKEREG